MSAVCPACGSEVRAGAKFCRACGAALGQRETGPPTNTSTASTGQMSTAASGEMAASGLAPDASRPRVGAPAPEESARLRVGEAEGDGRGEAYAEPPAAERSAAAPVPSITAIPKGRGAQRTVLLALAVVFIAALAGAALLFFRPSLFGTWRGDAVPKEAQESVRRGVGLAAQGSYDRALEEFTKAITLHPRYAVAYANRGVAYIQKRDYTRALSDLRTAAELAPADKMVHYNLAALYALRNEKDAALESIDRAFRHGFDDLESLRKDRDFDRLRAEPRFREILDRYRRNR